VISTGQGGALITNNDDIAHKIRRLKDFGRAKGGTDFHDTIGYNFKFTELQACLGIEQMKKLQWRVDRKKQIIKLYRKLLKDVSQVSFFDQDLKNTTPWFIDVFVEKRAELQVYLKEHNIGTRIMYPPINRQVAYKYPGVFPVSDQVGEKGLWLPSASQLTDEDINRVTQAIKDFYKSASV
jgi:perosamine synthetase